VSTPTISINQLVEFFKDQLRFTKVDSVTLARYIVEEERTGRVSYKDEIECEKSQFNERITQIVSLKGEKQPYHIFSTSDEKRLKGEVRELLSRCRETLEETV